MRSDITLRDIARLGITKEAICTNSAPRRPPRKRGRLIFRTDLAEAGRLILMMAKNVAESVHRLRMRPEALQRFSLGLSFASALAFKCGRNRHGAV